MSWYKHLILFWYWNILISNLATELLGRSQLTVPCTYAFHRILSMPRFNLSSVSKSNFYAFVTTAPFTATMSSFDQCRNIWLRHETNELCNFNPLKPELNPICYLLALLGAHHFLHVSRIRVKLLTFRLLMS